MIKGRFPVIDLINGSLGFIGTLTGNLVFIDMLIVRLVSRVTTCCCGTLMGSGRKMFAFQQGNHVDNESPEGLHRRASRSRSRYIIKLYKLKLKGFLC